MLRLYSLQKPCILAQNHPVPSARSVPAPSCRPRHVVVCGASSSSGGDSEAYPAAMSLADAYSALGLKENSSYEAVLDAKNKLLTRFQGQMEKKMEIETAYDVIFSQQLKARLSGDLPVSNKVRFADVGPAPRRQTPPQPITIPGGLVTVRQLPQDSALQSSLIFGALSAWTLVQGLTQGGSVGPAADVPGLQLALGTATTVYYLRQFKKAGLGKAGALAIGGLIAGTLIGSGLESWLRVDLIPIGALSSPGTVVGEFALAGLWAATFFLS